MFATGVGSMPGTDAAAYDEAVRTVFGELPDLPHLPELPGRGAWADLTGRALAVVSGLGADLQPAGWRLTDAAGIDQRRSRSLLTQDLDAVEERAGGYAGRFKVQLAGPWTLAATVERPRGDRVLADHGARRELAQALAEGLGDHLRDVRRRLPGVTELLVQVDEPALPAVLAGAVPTASGFHRHRSVEPAGAATALSWVLEAATAAGAVPVVHCCATDVPVALLRQAGARALSVDLDTLLPRAHEELAAALESGDQVLLGLVPAVQTASVPTATSIGTRVEAWLDMVGMDPGLVGDRLGVTPTCGLAAASTPWARRALELARTVAQQLTG